MKRPKNAVAVASAILLLGSVCQRCSSFAPPPSFGIQRRVRQVVSSTSTAVVDSTEESKSSSNRIEQKEFSYAAILKAVDESHYTEATQSCTYLGTEILTKHNNNDGVKSVDTHINLPFNSPPNPIMSDDAVRSLRSAAQRYFIEKKGYNRVEIDRVSLDDLLTSNESSDSAWKESLDDAMVKYIYPTIRSGWPKHDAFKESTQGILPVLTVTSASVFASGGYPGAKAVMTTFERDAGLFMVHIDLGNDHNIDDDDDVGSAVMGALYMESLVDESKMKSKLPIIGPLLPGQMIVHNSMQRTAAIMVPSDIHDLNEKDQSTVDCLARTHILRAAEGARHYALRLVVTTSINVETNENNNHGQTAYIPEAPSEERSYRLRSYARFCGDDRVRYLTLAGLLDIDDYENHLWLGFDYIARIDNPDYKCDLIQRLSDVNKAIFHLERAAVLCPTDSRVHFQLATAIGAKMDCEKRLMLEEVGDEYIVNKSDEALDRQKMAQALERSADLESAAVKLGVNDIQDLSICLNALAETRCKAGAFDQALDALDRWAECGSIRSCLAIEDTSAQAKAATKYEWIKATDKEGGQTRNVAVRTVGNVPVFEQEDISLLRRAADDRFAIAAGIQTSRYTMQYEGNSELHLDDLCAGDPLLKSRMDHVLQEKVYPLVRAAFAEAANDLDGDEPPLGPLCVYDSIFVRYNGDKAKAAGRMGASQPLHQDGGIYSVNIALNSAESDGNDLGFTGGGTFFEALTVGENECIQRPIAPGHAIIHKTTQRHAGAPTTSGVRDILVIFLTARRAIKSVNHEYAWRIERAMRLQSIGKELDRDKHISSLRLARGNDPTNSEIPYWLGVNLIEGDMNDESDERWTEISQGVESLHQSTMLNPADARAHYHLGMAISTRHKYAMRTKRTNLLPPAKEAGENLINAFESAISLERKCVKAGCENGINLSAAYLALGDFMARLKSFDKAIMYLNQVEAAIEEAGDTDKGWAQSMLDEVSSILEYCNSEIAEKMKPSLVR
jgi:tetratricopeptide (TPR) repeat protein